MRKRTLSLLLLFECWLLWTAMTKTLTDEKNGSKDLNIHGTMDYIRINIHEYISTEKNRSRNTSIYILNKSITLSHQSIYSLTPYIHQQSSTSLPFPQTKSFLQVISDAQSRARNHLRFLPRGEPVPV
jgi:hypothetical protein